MDTLSGVFVVRRNAAQLPEIQVSATAAWYGNALLLSSRRTGHC